MRNRRLIYVGFRVSDGKSEVFRPDTEPTHAEYGNEYAACMGPFRTVRAAQFTVDYGTGNPHIRCVSDAERIARQAFR